MLNLNRAYTIIIIAFIIFIWYIIKSQVFKYSKRLNLLYAAESGQAAALFNLLLHYP